MQEDVAKLARLVPDEGPSVNGPRPGHRTRSGSLEIHAVALS
jgi:hypothetical protein